MEFPLARNLQTAAARQGCANSGHLKSVSWSRTVMAAQVLRAGLLRLSNHALAIGALRLGLPQHREFAQCHRA